MFKKIISLLLLAFLLFGCSNMKDENLVLYPVKDDPTISFKIWFKVGSQNDPKGKEGLAALTAGLLSEGATKNNSYDQILEKLFPLAAGYSCNSSVEMTIFNGRVHKDNLDEYYPIFIDALLNPAFKEEDFNRIKQRTLNYLNTTLKYSSDEELGKAVLYNDIFDGTTYGHITIGTISGIESITIDDVKEFYNKYYSKNNFVIGLGGGYDEALIDRLQNDLAKLNDVQVEEIGKPQPEKIDGLNFTLIEKEAPATAISMGFPIDLVRGSKEWYALAVANSWFGEHRNSSSHLYQIIREERGLNYGDYSYIENFPNGGSYQMPPTNVPRRQQIFEIWIRPVPNETRHFVLRAALRELQMLVDNGMTKEDFELTRNFLKKYVLNFAKTTSSRLGYAIDDKFYGIDGSHLELFRKMMDEITLEDVNNAIKKHLQYDNMKIAIITKDAESFKNNLVANTTSPIEYSTPKPESVLEEDKNIIDYKLNIDQNKINIIQVEELFK
ncbi:MAG: insulinase family protein [Melioribacteraceae bacterium]|nr:insulinase family protein [Melioribacteraceae bacterium]